MIDTVTTLISFVIVIGIIVFFHEFGHFIAAKLSGVRVEVFSLGFPPKMLGRKYGETEYQLAWIPLGGYVKMTGMLDESFDDEFNPNDPKAFANKNFLRRAFIITAGVLMNMSLAFLIYASIIYIEGLGTIPDTSVSEVSAGSPAESAGIVPGDVIVAVAGQPVEEWSQLTDLVRASPNKPIPVSWQRGDSLLERIITPMAAPAFNFDTSERDTVGQLGVQGTLVMEPVALPTAVFYGAAQVVGVIELNVISIKLLITRKAGISDLSGPIGIAKMSGDRARSGLVSFISFIAFISIAIGFLNILPIPMLDGGHLAFMVIEAVIRRPIPVKAKEYMMKAGLAALLLLIIVVSYHDIVRVFFKG